MSKVCSKCKTEQSTSNFYSRGGVKKHLLGSWCKDCLKTPEYRDKANQRNRKYSKGTRSRLYQKNPLYYLWYIAKKRAEKNGTDFEITPEDILFTGFCPVSGEKLDVLTNKISTSVSLDRIDNSKGYVKGNVMAISRWANLKKSDMTIKQVESLLKYMKEYSQ